MADKGPLIAAVAYALFCCSYAFITIHFTDSWFNRKR